MNILGHIVLIGAFAMKPSPDSANEQRLRAIKALIEEHSPGLRDACMNPLAQGDPPDTFHEELAMRVALLCEDAAKIAKMLGSKRGQSAAFYQYMDAARNRLKAFSCHPLRQHLVRASEHIVEGSHIANESTILPEDRQKLQEMAEDVALKLKALDTKASTDTKTVVLAAPVSAEPVPPDVFQTPLPGPPEQREARVANKLDRVAVAVSASLTGIFFGAALGMGLSRVREPFEGLAHREVYEAAVASWGRGVGVPYGEGVDICAKGREVDDDGVVGACDTFDRLGRATIATSVLAGVSLVSTMIFTARLIRARTRRVQVAGGWQPGGLVFNVSGHF